MPVTSDIRQNFVNYVSFDSNGSISTGRFDKEMEYIQFWSTLFII